MEVKYSAFWVSHICAKAKLRSRSGVAGVNIPPPKSLQSPMARIHNLALQVGTRKRYPNSPFCLSNKGQSRYAREDTIAGSARDYQTLWRVNCQPGSRSAHLFGR